MVMATDMGMDMDMDPIITKAIVTENSVLISTTNSTVARMGKTTTMPMTMKRKGDLQFTIYNLHFTIKESACLEVFSIKESAYVSTTETYALSLTSSINTHSSAA